MEIRKINSRRPRSEDDAEFWSFHVVQYYVEDGKEMHKDL